MTAKLKGQLMRSWAIGIAISIGIVALDVISVHTPLQVVAIFLSIPLTPASYLFVAIERGWRLGPTALTVLMFTTEVLVGSVVYGALALLVNRLWDQVKPPIRSAG